MPWEVTNYRQAGHRCPLMGGAPCLAKDCGVAVMTLGDRYGGSQVASWTCGMVTGRGETLASGELVQVGWEPRKEQAEARIAPHPSQIVEAPPCPPGWKPWMD